MLVKIEERLLGKKWWRMTFIEEEDTKEGLVYCSFTRLSCPGFKAAHFGLSSSNNNPQECLESD